MSELDDLNAAMNTLKTEMPKNIDILKKIAEESQKRVGNWKTPLPGQKSGVRVDRKGTRLTKEVVERRKAKRMAYKAFGLQKVNGKWVKPNSTGGTEAPS